MEGDGITMVTGDLNATWKDNDRGGSNRGLAKWACSIGLANDFYHVNKAHQLGICSNFCGAEAVSLVDHFLTSPGFKIHSIGTSVEMEMALTSDSHRPIWASFSFVGGRGVKQRVISGRKSPSVVPAVQLNMRDDKQKLKYAEEMKIFAES